jgi:tellurium resistance protein TerD
MRDADELKAELKAAGAGFLLRPLIETQAVAAVLDEGERVQLAGQGEFDRTTVVVFATSKRLLLFKTAPGAVLLRSIPYGEVSSAECKSGLSKGNVSLNWSGRRIDVEIVEVKVAIAVCECVRAGIAPGTQPTGPAVAEEILCPKCGSRQMSANQKGFGLGKAVVGGVLLGPLGLLGGFFGSSNVKLTCLHCGHSWAPGRK